MNQQKPEKPRSFTGIPKSKDPLVVVNFFQQISTYGRRYIPALNYDAFGNTSRRFCAIMAKFLALQ